MVCSCTELSEVDACCRRGDDARPVCWRARTRVASQLSIIIKPPAVKVAVRAHGQRVVVSCNGLGEVDACRRGDDAWPVCWRAGTGAASQLAAVVVTPAVKVAVRAECQGKAQSRSGSTESQTTCRGRGEGDPGVSFCWPGNGGQAPGAGRLGPFGGQGDVAGDGPGEVVGDFVGEPSVEQVAVPAWVLVGPGGLSAAGDGLLAEDCVVVAFKGDGVGCCACLGLAVGGFVFGAVVWFGREGGCCV